MAIDPDALDRTEKLALDTGDARSPEEAAAQFRRYVLQVDVAALGTAADEAAFATIINTAPRAFKGGVHVRLADDPTLEHGWLAGQRASQALATYGCEQVATLSDDYPTLLLGRSRSEWPTKSPTLQLTYTLWSGGVLSQPHQALPAKDATSPAAGVLAAAIGVSEAFQLIRNNVQACRRDVGLSLWRPDLDWRDPSSWGPPTTGLLFPSRMHLVGLGHLGQAYLWTLGWMPFPDYGEIELLLQDVDRLVQANHATSLLASSDDLRLMKTRVLAARAEELGFGTRILERRLDETQLVGFDDPRIALIGVDNLPTRAMIGRPGWSFTVDAGLGGEAGNYLDVHVNTFPSSRTPEEKWGDQHGRFDQSLLSQPAYAEMERRIGDPCGVITIAGKAIASSFVGAFASALVVGELARYYADDAEHYEFVNASLLNLRGTKVARNAVINEAENLGYVTLL